MNQSQLYDMKANIDDAYLFKFLNFRQVFPIRHRSHARGSKKVRGFQEVLRVTLLTRRGLFEIVPLMRIPAVVFFPLCKNSVLKRKKKKRKKERREEIGKLQKISEILKFPRIILYIYMNTKLIALFCVFILAMASHDDCVRALIARFSRTCVRAIS